MSIEECLAEARKERRAEGKVDGERVTISLTKALGFLDFPYRWDIRVMAYWQSTHKYFMRRSSADSYFEELLDKYGLEEAEG